MYMIDFSIGFAGFGRPGRDEPSYWFFLMTDEFFSAETNQGKNLQQALMIFDKRVSDKIQIHMPHLGCETSFRNDILELNWTKNEKAELDKYPGLLITQHSLKSFSPRSHSWIYVNLLDIMDENGHLRLMKARDFLSMLALAVEQNIELFDELNKYYQQQVASDSARIFELNPNFMGLGINLKEMFKVIKKYVKK